MNSILATEIADQSATAGKALDYRAGIAEVFHDLPEFDHVLVAARGSSRHAGIYLQYALWALTGTPVTLVPAAVTTLYSTPPQWRRGGLFVAISQGGQSPDMLEMVEGAGRAGFPTVAVTNDVRSPLAGLADHVVDLDVGEERSLAATKTYTAQLLAMAAMVAVKSAAPALWRDLDQLPAHVAEQISLLTDTTDELTDPVPWTVIGRGYNTATAMEGALKLAELTCSHASAYSAAEYLHGPVAAGDRHTRLVVVAPHDPPTRQSLLEAASILAARGADILAVSPRDDPVPGARTTLPVIAGVPAWLSPVPAVIPLQHLAMCVAATKGNDVDRPRGLTKIICTR